MKILINEKLSQHRYLTPEGYLVCVDSVLARTGKQTYRRNEVFGDAEDDSEIEIDRTPEEVFSEETLASFENKPITVEHPDEDVNSENYKDYAVGFVRDIHKGRDNGQDVILGTLVIQDKKTIDEIKNGEHTDLSCGYDCDITEDEHPQQHNIRGNHVALCAQGRAGNARIVDTAINKEMELQEMDDKVKDEFFSDATQIKNIDKGYAILLRRVWDKRGEQAYAERWTDDIEEARRLKSTLERNDGFQFVIVQCHGTPKKVVDEETVLEMAEKYEKTPEIKDVMSKEEAIRVIRKYILPDKKYAHESYDGITYLTPEGAKKISEIGKESGLTRKDLERIDPVLFGPSGYLNLVDSDIKDEFEEETGPDMEDAPLHTYEIKWMDIYAKSKGWADYKHHDKVKAGTLREALEKLGSSAGFGIGTNNMLIINIHRDDGRTYTYTDRLANLLKKADLADEIEDAKQLPNTAELTKIERLLSDAGLLIVQIKYGSTSYVYNLKPKGSIFTEYKESDARAYQRKLAKIKNEIKEMYGYPVTYNVVLISGRLHITFAVNAKNTKDAVEDARIISNFKIDYELNGRKKSEIINADDIENLAEEFVRRHPGAKIKLISPMDSCKDALVEPDEKILKELERKLSAFKFMVESKKKNYFGGYHYQVRVPGHGFGKPELQFYHVQLGKIEDMMKRYEYPMTHNIGIDSEGRITAGLDIREKYVKDSVKDVIVAPDKDIVRKYETELKRKAIIESKHKNFMKGYHYRIRLPKNNYSRRDFEAYTKELERISKEMAKLGWEATYYTELGKDGSIGAEVDIYGKSVKDSAKDSATEYKKIKERLEKARKNKDKALLKTTGETIMWAPTSRLSGPESRDLWKLYKEIKKELGV